MPKAWHEASPILRSHKLYVPPNKIQSGRLCAPLDEKHIEIRRSRHTTDGQNLLTRGFQIRSRCPSLYKHSDEKYPCSMQQAAKRARASFLQTPESSGTFFHTQMEKMTCHWSHHPAIPLKFLPSIIPAWRKSYLFSGETNVSVTISTSYIYSVHWYTYKNSVKLP